MFTCCLQLIYFYNNTYNEKTTYYYPNNYTFVFVDNLFDCMFETSFYDKKADKFDLKKYNVLPDLNAFVVWNNPR